MIVDAAVRFYRRNVGFDGKERKRFLLILASQLEAGLSLSQVFTQQAALGYTKQVKDLCQHCVDQQANSSLYTSGLGDSGHFNEVETTMLSIGEERGKLVDIIEVLVKEERTKLNMWTLAIEPSKNPIMAAIIGLIIIAGMAMYKDQLLAMTTSVPAWVGYGDFLLNYWHVGLIFLVGIWGIYTWLGRNLSEMPRLVAVKYGLFRIADRQFGVEALRLAEILNRLEAAPAEVLDVWQRAFRFNPWHKLMLKRVSYRIEEGYDIVKSIEDAILEPKYARYLRSLAPLADPEGLSRGYPSTINIMENDLENMYGQAALTFQLGGWIVGGWAIYQVFPFLMGSGIVG